MRASVDDFTTKVMSLSPEQDTLDGLLALAAAGVPPEQMRRLASDWAAGRVIALDVVAREVEPGFKGVFTEASDEAAEGGKQMIPAKVTTLEEAYQVAHERFVATAIPQEVSTVFVERQVGDTLIGVSVVDHYVITAKPEADQ